MIRPLPVPPAVAAPAIPLTHRFADAAVSQTQRAYLRALRAADPDTAAITDALARRHPAVAETLVRQAITRFVAALRRDLAAALVPVWCASGQATATGLPRRIARAAAPHPSPAVSAVDLPFDFRLVNPAAVAAAEHAIGTRITGITTAQLGAVRTYISRAVLTGIPPAQAAQTVGQLVGVSAGDAGRLMRYEQGLVAAGTDPAATARMMERATATALRQRGLLIARTETIAASALGQQAAWQDGIARGVVDASQDGQEWLCVAPWTVVSAPGLLRAARRWYDGCMVRLTTASGRSITLTPNHEVLTDRGWIRAQRLHRDDSLMQVVRVGSFGAPEVQETPPPIGEVVDAALQRGPLQKMWAVPTKMDLNAHRRDGQVDVVGADSQLRLHVQASERVRELALQFSDERLGDLLLTGASLNAGRRQRMAGPLEAKVLASTGGCFRLPVCDPEAVRLGHASERDTGNAKLPGDGRPRGAEGQPDGLQALAGVVAADDIVAIEVVPWAGHVYDLSTVQSWYVANGLIVHNSTEGPRTCDTCAELDGTVVALTSSFPDGSTSPPAHPSCRCTLGLAPLPTL